MDAVATLNRQRPAAAAPDDGVRPLTVLDLRDTAEIGGPGKTIIETFNAIDRRRFNLHLGVFARREETHETPFIAAARAAGMPVHILRGYNQYDPTLIWKIVQLIRALHVDIVHTHEAKSDILIWMATRLVDVPVMTTLHGWISNSAKQRFLKVLDRHVVRSFERVVTVSRQMHDEVAADGYRPGRLCLLHNAIVLEKYQRSGHTGALARMLGEVLPRPILSCIGRLSAEKGQADLIDAIALVKARGRAVSLVLAGDGPARASLEERARGLEIRHLVHFAGHVGEPQRILEESDLAVLPSHTEGLPNAALEAMAMEVPLLATRVGGTPEVVVDGETGILVDARSPEQLARGIENFLDDPLRWRRFAAAGRKRVEQHFNFERRTRELESVYQAMHAERNR